MLFDQATPKAPEMLGSKPLYKQGILRPGTGHFGCVPHKIAPPASVVCSKGSRPSLRMKIWTPSTTSERFVDRREDLGCTLLNRNLAQVPTQADFRLPRDLSKAPWRRTSERAIACAFVGSHDQRVRRRCSVFKAACPIPSTRTGHSHPIAQRAAPPRPL